ncbi:MAG: thiol-disulfide oxidoreductase DCC family protein [Aggregatilineales bacterium]
MTPTVVLYDGLCALCVQSVRWIKRLDWRHTITYTDLQDWTTVHVRYPQLDRDAISGAMHVVGADGTVYVGYASVRQIIRVLPLIFWLYPLLYLPGLNWLGPKVYRWIATHRYQLNRVSGGSTGCENGACKLHSK